MRDANGVLEDVSAIIGFNATIRLVAIFAPGKLYVPDRIVAGHPIENTIGGPAFRRMVEQWPGQTIWLGTLSNFHHALMVRGIAALIKDGMPIKDIAAFTDLTERHVRNLRAEAEQMKLLPEILRGARGG